MNEALIDRKMNGTPFRPYGNIPEKGEDYDRKAYTDRVVENLGGPLRQFRSRMLDLGNLMCADEIQRRVFRDMVFQSHRDMAELLEEWCNFYDIGPELWDDYEEVE